MSSHTTDSAGRGALHIPRRTQQRRDSRGGMPSRSWPHRLFGTPLREARDRPVDIANVEELVALNAIAVGQIDANEGDLERTTVAHGTEQPSRRDATMAVPGEDVEWLLDHVRCQ